MNFSRILIERLFGILPNCIHRAPRRAKFASMMTGRLEALENRVVLTDPEFTSAAFAFVQENSTLAMTVEATDADFDPLTFSLVGTGADDALLNIDPDTGELTFLFNPDFEQTFDSNGDGVYEIDVQVTDQINAPVIQNLTITILDIDDETPQIMSDALITVPEGTDFLQTVFATDLDAGSVLEYSLTGNGADDFLFLIDSVTGGLSFAIVTDFANPADADQNNIYECEVQVTDGFQSSTQVIQVTIEQNNAAPVLAFNDGAITFKKGKSFVEIAPNATVTGNAIGGGTLVVSINNVNTGKKRADIFDTTSIEALGNRATVLTNGRYVTTVTLDPGITAGDVELALRELRFFTSKKGLKFTTRNVKIQLLDGNFNVSNEITKTINVRKK